MTTMQIDRAVVEQALEVINDTAYGVPVFRQEVRDTITALRAALAQQDEPVAYTAGHCENHKQKGGCQLHNLQCGWPDCDRKPTTASSQQAEPVEPHRWKGDNNIESPFNACMHKTYCMTLKQAEPLNLRDPAVQKRLATQWGYVPAAQAEPVEPVDVGLLEYRGNSVAFIHQKMTAYRAGIDAAWDAFRAKGLHPDGKTPLANMIAKYTAPPQRLPLTEEEIERIGMKHVTLREVIRAVERAHGIKE